MERGYIWENTQLPITEEDCDFEGYFDYVQREDDNEYEQRAHKTAEKFFGIGFE